MPTIGHAGSLTVSDPETLTADRVAMRALQVARPAGPGAAAPPSAPATTRPHHRPTTKR